MGERQTNNLEAIGSSPVAPTRIAEMVELVDTADLSGWGILDVPLRPKSAWVRVGARYALILGGSIPPLGTK